MDLKINKINACVNINRQEDMYNSNLKKIEKSSYPSHIDSLLEVIQSWKSHLKFNSIYCYELLYKETLEKKLFNDLKDALRSKRIPSTLPKAALMCSYSNISENSYNYRNALVEELNLLESKIEEIRSHTDIFAVNNHLNDFRSKLNFESI